LRIEDRGREDGGLRKRGWRKRGWRKRGRDIIQCLKPPNLRTSILPSSILYPPNLHPSLLNPDVIKNPLGGRHRGGGGSLSIMSGCAMPHHPAVTSNGYRYEARCAWRTG